jgi:hypothetical protein
VPGTLSEPDVVDDLKRSLNDAGGVFNTAGDADWRRFIATALVAMETKRPRTLLGTVTLTAEEVRYPLSLPEFAQYKTHVWGARALKPWLPAYPGALPRVAAVQEGAGAWALMFDPAPTAGHISAYGSNFKFWYFGKHALALDPAPSTLAPGDRPLLLLRAQAEAMRELSMRNVNKPVSVRDGFSGAPRNSTPAALFQVLLQEFEAAR